MTTRTMNIQAINNYCTLEILPLSEEIKVGLISLPGEMNNTQRWAKILSVGQGATDWDGKDLPMSVEPDQLAYVASHGQYEIHKNAAGESTSIAACSELDILAILENEETMEIKPLGQYIEIEKVEFDGTNEYGIELIDTKKLPTNIGIVKRVGTGFIGPSGNKIPFHVKEGDKVIFNPLRTLVVDFSYLGKDHKKYLVFHSDIIGIVTEE